MSRWIVTQKKWIVNANKIVMFYPVSFDNHVDIYAAMGTGDNEYIMLGEYRTGAETIGHIISFLMNHDEAVFIMPEAESCQE